MKAYPFNETLTYLKNRLEEIGADEVTINQRLTECAAGFDCEGVGPIAIGFEGKLFMLSYDMFWFDASKPALIKPVRGVK